MGLTSKEVVEKVSRLKNHYILCGAGRTGRNIITRFCATNTPVVVLEQDPDAILKLQPYLEKYLNHMYFIQADATEDEALERAGIAQAAGMFAALSDDKDNLFATLTARSLNPHLRIVTRVIDEKNNLEKLKKAGADKVISTDVIGGMRIASEMIRPEVVKFLDQMLRVTDKEKTLRFTELPLTEITTPQLVKLFEANKQAGKDPYKICIKDIGRYTGLLVVAIKSPDNETTHKNNLLQIKKRYRFTPRGDAELHSGDILVVIGTQDKLDEVTNIENSHPNDMDTRQKNA